MRSPLRLAHSADPSFAADAGYPANGGVSSVASGPTQVAAARDSRRGALRAQMRDLEEQCRSLTSGMAALETRSSAALRTKASILGNLNHEFRTPLNAIIGFADLILMDETENAVASGNRDYVVAIRDSGNHLLSMIEDLLEISELEQGLLPSATARIDPAVAVDGAIDDVRDLAADRRVRFRLSAPLNLPTVAADPPRLRQAIRNVLANAVRRSPEDGTVLVALDRRDDHVQISILDQGTGASPDFLNPAAEHLDREAFPAETDARTGLGLAIARSIIESHDGSYECEWLPGTGGTVHIGLRTR